MALLPPAAPSTFWASLVRFPADYQTKLRTVVVGPDYRYRVHSETSGAGYIAEYDSVAGTSGAWPSVVSGEVVDTATAEIKVVDALVRYFNETGSPTIANGRQYSTLPNVIEHDEGVTVFAGSGRSVAVPIDVAVGDFVKLDNGVTTFTSRVTALGGGNTRLTLADSLPAGFTGVGYFLIALAEVATVDVPTGNRTATSSLVGATSGMAVSTARTGSTYPVISATGFSKLYTTYRAVRAGTGTTIETVTTLTELEAAFENPTQPECELGFALYGCLSPTAPGANGTPTQKSVAFIRLASETSWADTFAFLKGRPDWSYIAVTTSDDAYLSALYTMLEERAALNLGGVAYVSPEVDENVVLVTGAGNTVTVSGTTTVVRDGGVAAPFADAVPGDKVVLAGTPYTIATVVSGQQVTITTAATNGTGIALTEVYHPRSVVEMVDAFGAKSQSILQSTVVPVFPTRPTWNNAAVPGYLLAAHCAGARGMAAPQQSLVSFGLPSGWTLSSATASYEGYFATLANYGALVVGTYEIDPALPAVVVYANTSDQTSTLSGQEGYAAQAASILNLIYVNLLQIVANANTAPSPLDSIHANVTALMEQLKSSTAVGTIGAIFQSYAVSSPYVNPAAANQVIVPLVVRFATRFSTATVSTSFTLAV